MDTPASDAAKGMRLLSALLLAPFVVLAVWIFAIALDHPWRTGTIAALTAYGALLLCLFGGISAGLALQPAAGFRRLAAALLPVWTGLAAILTPAPYCFAVLAAGFAAQGAWDAFASPGWLSRTRSRDTVIAVASFILAFVATAN